MNILKTEKDELSEKDILGFIHDYQIKEIPLYDKLWSYYVGENTAILKRSKAIDPNNPDNRISVPYAKKIITTYSGYAFRPRYITYKPNEVKGEETKTPVEKVIEKIKSLVLVPESKKNEMFYKELENNFNINREHIKTNRAGRNTAIFGVSYELVYIETEYSVKEGGTISKDNVPKFISIDPRELILLYDYSIDPKKKVAIRFYKGEGSDGKVEVYYSDKIEKYKWITKKENEEESLVLENTYIGFFGEVPIVAYYLGDEMTGLIKPVLSLIDAYDVLVSDSMNEFDRFAFAYLIMKKFGLTDQAKKQSPEMVSNAAKALKRKRMFEHLPEGAEISFLTKDIPHEFIAFMSGLIREQIHIQSHVPDFTSEKMSGASGIAIQRLLFDFENVCSSAEADFDIGLSDRIRLISTIFKATGKPSGDPGQIVITHKRNIPQNGKEFADLALTMKQAGFSRYAVADVMPDDIIPDVEKELERQNEDMEAMLPDIENMGFGGVNDEDPNLDESNNNEEEE